MTISRDTMDAAGIAFVSPDGLALFVRRSDASDFGGYWCLPGGMREDGETLEQAARREAFEEVGIEYDGELAEVAASPIGDGPGTYTTFLARIDDQFRPTINDESSGFAWLPLNAPPEPLHPGLSEGLAGSRSAGGDDDFEEIDGEDNDDLDWGEDEIGDVAALDEAVASDSVLAYDRAIFSSAGAQVLRPGLAFDRGSVRSYDVDGRLRVQVANISKANICPYVGHEIPGWEALGLDKAKIYHLFRDPEELEKAAPTFNNLPLLEKHVAVSADDHQPDLVIGATGSDATFKAPYLTNSLVVWAKSGIDGIEDNEKKELSSAYHYRADMTPGEYLGTRYDGVMREICGNHVAVVCEGRAGTDVVVGDSKEHVMMASKQKTTIRSVLTIGAVVAFLQPRLKKDAGNISFDHALDGLTSTNFGERKKSIIEAVTKATKGKLAHDASVDGLEQVLNMLEGGKGGSADADPVPMKDDDKEDNNMIGTADADVPSFLKGKLSEDDYKTCMDMISKGAAKDKDPKLEELGAAGDAEKDDDEEKKDDAEPGKDAAEPPPFKGKPEVGAKAMDAAIKSAVKVATDSAIKTQRGIREAETAVRPWVGELTVAFDSAEGVYRHALSMLGVDHKDVHASALKHILGVQPKPGARPHNGADPAVAMDAAATDDFTKRFPEAARLRQF